MNNKSVNHSIQELIEELQYLAGELRKNPASTSQLELDLMKEKIRRIYEQLSDVKIINQFDEEKEVEPVSHPIEEAEQVDMEHQKSQEAPEIVFEIEEKIQEEVEVFIPEEKKEEELFSPPTEPTLDLFDKPTNNLIDEDHKSVGEKIAEEKPVESIGEVIQNKNRVSLKLAIGINEKFFFLNELFEGKMNEYTEAIEQLDQKETFNDAIECLAMIKKKKNWDEETEAFIQLKGFLERKFN